MVLPTLSLRSGALSAVVLLSLYSKSKQQNSYMKKTLLLIATLLTSYVGMAQETYQPTAENLKATRTVPRREVWYLSALGTLLNDGYYRMDYDQQGYQL